MTLDGRLLVVILEMRSRKRRVVTTRDATNRERRIYRRHNRWARENLIPVTDPDQVPEGMSEKEAREFWDTHELTEEYIRKAGLPPEGVLPPVRVPTERAARENEA
jgi:hypothetical protein